MNRSNTLNASAGNRLRLAASAAAGVGLALAAGGCLVLPRPASDLSSRHVASPPQFVAALGDERATSSPVLDGWLTSFDDPTLRALVLEAWRNNPDLYTTASRFEEATAALRVAASQLFPQISGLANATRTDVGDGPDEIYLVGLQATWEIDLWGRIRASRAFALQLAEAAGLDYIQARHSLAAAVADSYFFVVTSREQLNIDLALQEAQQATADATRQLVDAGLGTTLDSNLAESNLLLANAAVQADLQALAESKRSLELLLGSYPAALVDSPDANLPQLPAGPTAVGVPSELLERRPDVRAAARRVDAAFYDVKRARAARLPTLTLSGQGGTGISPSDLITNLTANIVAPLFYGGLLQSQQYAATARQRQALGGYATTALQAFREVESALANEQYLAQRQAQLDDASGKLVDASRIAENRYQQGIIRILDLQQIRNQDYATRSQLLGVRFQQLRQRLNLYLALGGPVFRDPALDPTPEMNDLGRRQFVESGYNPVSGDRLQVGTPPVSTAPPATRPAGRTDRTDPSKASASPASRPANQTNRPDQSAVPKYQEQTNGK